MVEPFLADLVAADVEISHVLVHAFETGRLRLVQPDGVLGPRDFFDCWAATVEVFRDGLGQLGRFQQVQGGEFAVEAGQRAEQLQLPGQRQAREIYLQKLRVATPVAGTVKHAVAPTAVENGIKQCLGNDWLVLSFMHLAGVKEMAVVTLP